MCRQVVHEQNHVLDYTSHGQCTCIIDKNLNVGFAEQIGFCVEAAQEAYRVRQGVDPVILQAHIDRQSS